MHMHEQIIDTDFGVRTHLENGVATNGPYNNLPKD